MNLAYPKSDNTTDLAQKRIIVALDVANEREAIELVTKLRSHVGIFKIGLELLTAVGITMVQKISELGGKVFLDAKFKDIPNTVAGASRAVTRLGVEMFNVHTMGGIEMMNQSVKAAEEEASTLGAKRPLILGVTILTSIDQVVMNQQLGIPGDIESQVIRLAGLADKAGLDGVIASPNEIEAILKNVSRNLLIVTPGVRPKWAAADDQKRIMG